ncbi:MAG: hypothetical protein WC710_15175 [Gallionella sp.]
MKTNKVVQIKGIGARDLQLPEQRFSQNPLFEQAFATVIRASLSIAGGSLIAAGLGFPASLGVGFGMLLTLWVIA